MLSRVTKISSFLDRLFY